MSRAKRALAALLVAITAACGGGGTAQPSIPIDPPAIPRASTLRIIAFGDSITAGKDLADPDRESWPALVERALREEGRDVVIENAGVSGNTTFEALDRLDFTLAPVVTAAGEGPSPALVVVCLGSNDAFQAKPLRLVEENLEAIIRRCRERGARVLLVALKTFPNFGPEYGGDYEAIFPRVARRAGADLAPFLLEGVAGDRRYNLADGIHPNAAGYRIVAENLLPAIRESLDRAVRERAPTREGAR